MTQTMIPVGEDYCTVAYAAELAGVSIRTVVRAVGDGVLVATRPRCGSRESARHKLMLHTSQVRQWVAARTMLRPNV
jgi:hypothetical protein